MVKSLARATAALALVAAPMLAQDTRPTVAVLPFVNSAIGASNAELAPLSKGIADLLITDMAQNTGIRVVERENIERILAEQNLARDGRVANDETAARIGRLLGARHLVTGSFITDRSGTMVVTLKSVNTETGVVEWTHREQDKTDNFLTLVNKVTSAANTGLKLPALTPAARQTSEAKAEKQAKVPFQAVMLYSRGIAAKDAGNKTEAIELFNQALKAFPKFEDAEKAKQKLESGS